MTGGASVALEVAGFSDIGPVRMENQDAWRSVELGDGVLGLLLADGMGGHNGGREAAESAVEAAANALAADGSAPDLAAAIAAANSAVAGLVTRIGGRPGTTLVAAVVGGRDATVANVGDSRAYLIAAGAATQLTQDHSWVAEQVRLGQLSQQEARRSRQRNVITRAVMGDPVEADLFSARLGDGDVLLLCSDGVWEPIDDTAIARLLSTDQPLSAAVERLCRAALEAGGTDNATALAVRRAPG